MTVVERLRGNDLRICEAAYGWEIALDTFCAWGLTSGDQGYEETSLKCPYGKPGDRLYVRETWATLSIYDDSCPSKLPKDAPIWYLADGPKLARFGRTRQSIHMPRCASRLTLEIVSVKVRRIQDTTEEDAKAEGVEPWFNLSDPKLPRDIVEDMTGKPMPFKNYLWHGHFGDYGCGNKQTDGWAHQFSNYENARGSFSSLWELINGPRGVGWEVNPWTWAIEFKVVA